MFQDGADEAIFANVISAFSGDSPERWECGNVALPALGFVRQSFAPTPPAMGSVPDVARCCSSVPAETCNVGL